MIKTVKAKLYHNKKVLKNILVIAGLFKIIFIRTYHCENFGIELDRDLNTSLNMAKIEMIKVGMVQFELRL
ncbi:MAG: hypothetical protein QXX11_04745 [Thermoplasmata archaeon]